MNDHPFTRFIDLVSFDQQLQSLEHKKIQLNNEIDSLKAQETILVREQEDLSKTVIQCKKEVDTQELEMKTLDQKEREKKHQLDLLSEYKEYQSKKNEIEAVQRMQMEQEKYVLHAWAQLEAAQANAQKKTIDIAEQLHLIHEKIKDLGQNYSSVESECAQLLSQRSEKESNIPAEWLEKYSMMRARVSDPVIKIIQQSCSSCSQMLTHQELMRAQRGALVQCQKCYRLLYSADIMEKHS